MTDDGRVDRETAVGGVFIEGALEDRVVAVRRGHGGAKIIEDDPTAGAAAEAAQEMSGVSAEALLEPEARGRNLYQKPGPELAP